MEIVLIVIGVLLLLIVGYVIVTYNNLVRAREFVRNSMGQIAAQVESRWDGVRSLIDATKKYASHEAETITQTTQARSRITRSSSVEDVQRDDARFASVLGRINAVAEAYPELRASDVFTSAMTQITDYENNVRHSRMFFNDSTTKYNNVVLQFPSNLVASMFSFTPSEYFESTDTKSDMPQW